MSNGSWGFFFFVFWTCPIKTTPHRTLLAFVLWHKNIATQYVIKLFSEIIDAQCLTNKLAPLAKLGRIDRSVLLRRTEGMIDLYDRVARKEWSINWSVDNPPPTILRWWNSLYEFCDSVGQWILFCVGSLLLYGRQRDFYMLLNCVRAQNSIIQLPSLGELQYNNGYWWDRTDQGTSGKLKEYEIFLSLKIWKKAFSFFIFKSLKTRVAAIGPRCCNRFYSGR